jgi:HTH-type transcriptional regulator/antitoxin HigA
LKEPTVIEAENRAYRPDYAIPPGETVRSTLDALGMTQADLSRRTGLSAKHINQIIQGAAPITPDTALALERVLGVPARFWNALEANHQSRQLQLREREVSPEDRAWLDRLPIKELVHRGKLEATGDLGELRDRVLGFFGVATRQSWDALWRAPEVAFRRSKAFEADPYATAAWLRIGELEAAKVEAEPFDRGRFVEALGNIRGMMVLAPEQWDPEMKRLAATAGVVVVIYPEIKKSRINGAARWLSPTKALIQLSLRYRWEDIFWFSFFHEAGHILLHGKRETFIDDDQAKSAQEDEANEFAASLLIPRQHERELWRVRTLTDAQRLASQLGIPPGIVVGRLQREGILEYRIGNGLRQRFVWSDD